MKVGLAFETQFLPRLAAVDALDQPEWIDKPGARRRMAARVQRAAAAGEPHVIVLRAGRFRPAPVAVDRQTMMARHEQLLAVGAVGQAMDVRQRDFFGKCDARRGDGGEHQYREHSMNGEFPHLDSFIDLPPNAERFKLPHDSSSRTPDAGLAVLSAAASANTPPGSRTSTAAAPRSCRRPSAPQYAASLRSRCLHPT